MQNFPDCIAHVLAAEGGLVNDPKDPGGVTKFGISQRSYPALDIRALSLENAKANVYRGLPPLAFTARRRPGTLGKALVEGFSRFVLVRVVPCQAGAGGASRAWPITFNPAVEQARRIWQHGVTLSQQPVPRLAAEPPP